MTLRTKVLLSVFVLLVAVSSESLAEEANYASYSPVVYVVAGLLIVDVGASLGNGIALARSEPDRMNGYFGLVSGILSLGLVAVNFAMEDDDDLRNGFALMMGTAGTASLVFGAMNIHRSRQTRTAMAEIPRMSVFPSLSTEREQGYRIGVNVNITF